MSNVAESITATENALRELAIALIKPKVGEWAKSGVTDARLLEWEARRRAEGLKRRTVVEEDLIYFSDMYDLNTILQKNWEAVAPVLGKLGEFKVDVARLEAARNTLAHGRELLPYEVSDVDGISGRIRTAVTLFRGRSRPGGREHFPRLESVFDSVGTKLMNHEPGTPTIENCPVVLRPGDRISFTARGWDPDGLPFQTFWRSTASNAIAPGDVRFDGSFTWDVNVRDISESHYIVVTLVGTRPYHRQGSYDDEVIFKYVVLPPT